MNNLVKFGIAAAIIGAATTSANAQSVVPFDYTDTINGGTVTVNGTPPSGSIASVSGVTTNLSSGLPVAFASGLYTFDYSSLTNIPYCPLKTFNHCDVINHLISLL